MATSTIKGTGGYKYSVLTSPLTGATLTHNTCFSDGNVVTLGLTINDIDVPVNGTVANVPAGFRPNGNAARAIGIATINGNDIPLFTTIDSDGNVKIGYSSSINMTSFNFAATYGIH